MVYVVSTLDNLVIVLGWYSWYLLHNCLLLLLSWDFRNVFTSYLVILIIIYLL